MAVPFPAAAVQKDNHYEPVWRLVLQHQLTHDNPRVVRAAEKALAESLSDGELMAIAAWGPH
jgi:hypothetical protein